MSPTGTRGRSILFVVLTAFALVYVGIGAKLALDQRRALENAHSVPAIVTGIDIEEHHPNGNHAVTYRPVVRFEYQVNGTTRMGDQVDPLRESRGGHWAWRVLDRYQAGQHVTAWVRDDRADVAYLERTTSPRPFYMMAFGVAFAAFSAWMWRRDARAITKTAA